MASIKERTLGIVLAHGKVRDTVLRHRPIWEKNARQLVFFTPCDDPLDIPGIVQYGIGKSCAYCADTNIRCREALRLATFFKHDYTMLCEYDSVIFRPLSDEDVTPAGVTATKFLELQVNKQFKGNFYLHFPHVYSHSALAATVRSMDTLRDDAEQGFTDRYVGLAVERASGFVKNTHDTGAGYSQNHIQTAAQVELALEAYRKGAHWTHGIKDKWVFQTLLTEAKKFAATQGIPF